MRQLLRQELMADRGRSVVAQTALAIVLVGVFANLLFNAIAVAVGAGYPYSSFLFLPSDRFGDFFKLAFSYPGLPVHPAAHYWGFDDLLWRHQLDAVRFRGTDINHFHVPPVPTLLALGARWLVHWVDPVLLFLGLLAVALTGLFATVLRLSPEGRAGAALATAALLGYPTLLAIDRGHFFSLICAALIIGATLRTLRDDKADGWSILMFAIAVNIRPNVGIVPLALFLTKEKFGLREAILLGVASLALFAGTLAAVHWIYPAYTLESFRAGLSDYADVYVEGMAGYPYGSSLYGAFRASFGFKVWTLLAPLAVASLLFALALICSRRRLMRPSEYLFLILCTYALGSQIFADYHLLVFIIPLVLLAREGGLIDQSRWTILIASSFVMAPKNYWFVPNDNYTWSWQVVMNPAVLFIASVVVLACAVRRQDSANRASAALSS
jgi:hypothetical protein